ncbi:RIP metalloprotease RseP [Alicyclobacillus tolerans]|uniref:RIP metalloprotease RseP n=1 Tax=Alicyclobacillus tolerans TaxID=90970 RepID=UPI001F01D09E|nr:RIP metalloprotease RseP [Alicyclobacillus tolerans]MCF8564786.1 RIP metalloprotease RseP [Alicyclobacillus tolerans]
MTVAFLVGALKSVIAVVAVFVVSIVLHEFGHFIVAKRFGVAVPAFAVGFGPKLFKRTWRGTEYSVRLFPIGGLVQLAGEMPQDALFRKGEQIAVKLNSEGWVTVVGDPVDVRDGIVGTLRDLDLRDRLQMTIEQDGESTTYKLVPHTKLMMNARSSMPLVEKHEQMMGKPIWQRAAIILAGPVMNFLLAGVLFSLLYAHTGIPLNAPTLGKIIPGSAAASAGLMQGDRVVSVNGHTVSNWMDLVTQIQNDKGNPPKPLTLKIDRSGRSEQVVVTPRLNQGVPMLGVDQPVSHDKLRAVGGGFASVYYGSVNALHLYGQVIQHPHKQMGNLSGPVGIADVIGQQAQLGIWHVIMITGLLSLNLGLFNLLPIPALDGGRLLFMLFELVRGKAVDPRKEGFVHFVGFALLMLFAVVVTYRDVTRLF